MQTAPTLETSRLTQLARVAVLAAIAVAILVAISQAGIEDQPSAPAAGQAVSGAVASQRLFAGIPQDGAALGNPRAPVTLVEFADLQCPFCGEFDRGVLPEVVQRYVRTGQVRVELRPLTFLGPDSARMAGLAAAAAAQDRMWQLVHLLYANQGRENSGYASDAYLAKIARATPGLDAERALRERSGPAATEILAGAEADAARAGIDSTPSFLAGPTGGTLSPLRLSDLTPASMNHALDRVLGR